MSPSPRAIRANAERLHQLHERIDETFKHRSRSSSELEAWKRACADFHRQFDELSYPGGAERWAALMRSDSSEIEVAINYLEADPWHFRSGYQKEAIWDRLKKVPLLPGQLRQLEHIALAYLPRRAYRHFWYMVRFVRLRARDEFWSEVERLGMSTVRTPETIKATWLLLARANRPVQQWIRTEQWRPTREPGHAPNMDFLRRDEA
jgi:hypothetical protein